MTGARSSGSMSSCGVCGGRQLRLCIAVNSWFQGLKRGLRLPVSVPQPLQQSLPTTDRCLAPALSRNLLGYMQENVHGKPTSGPSGCGTEKNRIVVQAVVTQFHSWRGGFWLLACGRLNCLVLALVDFCFHICPCINSKYMAPINL